MCYKKSFTKVEAQAILNKNKDDRGRRQNRGRRENRYYHCEECNLWHLTSMDEDSYNLKKEQVEDVKLFNLTVSEFKTLMNELLDERAKEEKRKQIERDRFFERQAERLRSGMMQKMFPVKVPWYKRMFKTA